MRIDIALFDTEEATIKKAKWHFIELDEDVFHFRANYLSDEKIEEEWKECWRFWDDTHYKNAVTSYGYSRTMLEKEWYWEYRISLFGMAEDILFLFESQDIIKSFHESFRQYMQPKYNPTSKIDPRMI
jgi:hypothetical protein